MKAVFEEQKPVRKRRATVFHPTLGRERSGETPAPASAPIHDAAERSWQAIVTVAAHASGTGKTIRQSMELPLAIGSGPESDIVVNAAGLAALAKIVWVEKRRLRVFDVVHREEIPVASLERIGLKFSPPTLASGRSQSGARGLCAAALQRVDFIQEGLPPKIRKLTGGHLPTSLRRGILAAWVAGFVAILFAGVSLATRPAPPVDLSATPIALAWGQLRTGGIGAAASVRNYANGFTLSVDLPAAETSEVQSLSFEAKGLDLAREIVIAVNGQEVHASEASRECFAQYCNFAVRIDPTAIPGILKPGANQLFFRHEPHTSDYVVRNILLIRLAMLTDAERILVHRGYERAQRAFDERGISITNLVTARSEATRVRELLRTHRGAEEILPLIEALSVEIEAAARATREEVAFRARKELQLGRLTEAHKLFETLLTLWPDPRSVEHRQIREEMATIQELRK